MRGGEARPAARAIAAALAAVALLAGCGGAGSEEREDGTAGRREIGLVTSLPILWPEVRDPGDLLAGDAPPHWALSRLRRHGEVRPLDALASPDGKLPLATGDILVLAQPYPLSPLENVALDAWVRAGGRALLFADPMLTRQSAYPLGDRRRPQAMVLISPILSHWGLELQFDDAQAFGERRVSLRGGALPVNLPGRFALLPGARGCRLEAGGLLADCAIGRGRVVALADAALLDEASGGEARARAAVLDWLVDRVSG